MQFTLSADYRSYKNISRLLGAQIWLKQAPKSTYVSNHDYLTKSTW